MIYLLIGVVDAVVSERAHPKTEGNRPLRYALSCVFMKEILTFTPDGGKE
jgi:hypothetical protein